MGNIKQTLLTAGRVAAPWRARLALTLLATAAMGLGAAASANAKGPPDAVKAVTFVGSAGFFTDDVAQQEGFFKQEGLDVQFLQVSSGAQYLQLLVSGSIQGGITDLGPALTAIGKGADIKVIGATVDRNVFELTVATGQTWADGLTDWKQIMQALVGRPVGVSGLGAATDISLRGLLFAAGINPSKVHIIGIGTEAAAATQLRAGAVQAAIEEFEHRALFHPVRCRAAAAAIVGGAGRYGEPCLDWADLQRALVCHAPGCGGTLAQGGAAGRTLGRGSSQYRQGSGPDGAMGQGGREGRARRRRGDP